ncbi:hypothetical protein AAFF_G00372460 [Aldrovandia affinis]|uniref:Fibronectin type-III domain-containing protein n=1 Tax=Aldrovandia affinis TaxID=143900 RepID=A0AAD7WM09_9TELE|nr:hypothetical protein AAFF_G00372460 [Aldrovandia affinis]
MILDKEVPGRVCELVHTFSVSQLRDLRGPRYHGCCPPPGPHRADGGWITVLTCPSNHITSSNGNGSWQWPVESCCRCPHFTGCLSREMETFRCSWSAGSFQNLTESGDLRVFFLRNTPPKDWQECPQYNWSAQSECFFDKTHTSIWTTYCIQLVSRDRNVTYDHMCFSVENIVHPDPPVGLNWTLLNVSRSKLHFDAMVHWEPPSSADVETGWMSLVYEVQYREKGAPRWHLLSWEKSSRRSVYGLRTDTEYELRVRCKMPAFDNCGEFSEIVLIFVPQIPTKESGIPVVVVLIFGTVAVGVLLMLVIFSQQQRLMVIFLPPVPAPKIKGIDPELLKKGKLDQLSSILSSHIYKPGMALEDPWVEHIELDFDELSKRAGPWDTQRLLHPSPADCPYDLLSGTMIPAEPAAATQTWPIPTPLTQAPHCPPRTYSPPADGQGLLHPGGRGDPGRCGCPGVWSRGRGGKGATGGGGGREEEDEVPAGSGAPAGGGYTSEMDARRINCDLSPALDYTLVQDVNEQHSLLLNPTPPHPTHIKPLLLPAGYLSPDLLASINP